MKPSWRDLTQEQREELDRVPRSVWREVPRGELPGVFVDRLRRKILSALLISLPTSTGGDYLIFSAHRVDKKAIVDIQPFGVIVHSTGPGPTAVFVNHGHWEGESELPRADFWSGIDSKLLDGTMDQLPKGHRGAVKAVIRQLRTLEDGKTSSL